MAQLQDITGRLVTMEGELSEVTGLLRQMLNRQDLGAAIPYYEEEKKKNEERNTKLDEIKDIMQTLSDDFKEEMDKAEEYTNQIKEAVESLRPGRERAGGETQPTMGPTAPSATMGFDNLVGSMSDLFGKNSADMAKSFTREEKLLSAIAAASRNMESDIRTLVDAATTKGCIHAAVDISAPTERTNKILEQQVKELTGRDITVDATPIGGGGAGGGGGKPDPCCVPPDDSEAKEAAKTWQEHFYKAGIFGTLAAALAGFIKKMSPVENIFKGVIKDEFEFMQQMRATAFEVDGISASTRSLQEEWQQTGKVVARTGVNLSDFQKVYVKNLRAGVISQKEALEVTKSGLHLSQMIGSSEEQTAETMMQWHKTMGMNNNQMAQFGRSLQDVARLTGVTGDNLMEAVKASEELVKNMRNAGQLTAAAASNLTATMASAQKLGVAEGTQEIMKALSGTYSLLNEASNETKTFLFNAGVHANRFGDVWSGTISQSKKGMKDLAGGMRSFVESVMGTTFEDFDKLDKQQKARLNFIVKNVTGKSVNEAKRIIESIEEGAQTYGDRIEKINKKLEEQTLTLEERKKLEEDRLNMQIGGGFEFLNAFDEAAKKGLSLSDATKDAFANNEDLADSLKSMGVDVDFMAPSAALEKAALFTAERLKEAGGADFTPQIQKALDTGDTQAMREVLSDMNAAQQELAMDTKKGLDPMTEMAHNFNKINETVRSFTGPALRKMAGIIMWLSVIAGTVGSIWAAMIGLGELKKGLGKLFGGGAARAAGAAGKTKDVFLAGMQRAEKYVPSKIKDMFAEGMGRAKGVVGKMLPEGLKGTLSNFFGNTTKTYRDVITEQSKAGMGALKAQLSAKHAEKLKQLRAAKGAMAGAPAGDGAPKFGTKGISQMGDQMKKAAPAILKAAIGLALAAAAVIVLIKILQAVGIGPKEAWAGALAITGILAGVAAIGAAVMLALPAFQATGKAWPALQASLPDLLIGAAVIAIAGPAIVLLGTAIVAACRAIVGAFGLDAGTVAKTALNVAAILSAAAAIAVATATGLLALTGIGFALSFLTGPQALAALALLGLGAATILAASTLMVGIAAAIVKSAQIIMGAMKLDAATTAKVAMDVAVLLAAAAGLIMATGYALAELATTGLAAIALFAGPQALAVLAVLGAGAAAMLLAVPIIVTIAAAIVKSAQAILGLFNLDAKTCAKVGLDVAALLMAAAFLIAGAAAGLLALYGIGSALTLMGGPLFLKSLAKVGIGAAAVLVAVPVLTFIAASVVKIAQGIMGLFNLDAGTCAKIAEDMGALLKAAAFIVAGAAAGLYALYGIGLATFALVTGPQFLFTLKMIGLGTLAVLTAVPVLTFIAASVVKIAQGIMGLFNLDAGTCAKVAEDVGAMLKAAASIIKGVATGLLVLMGIGAAVSLLIGPLGLAMLKLVGLGAAAVLIATPILVGIATGVVKIAQGIMGAAGLDSGTAAKVAEDVSGLLQSAAAIVKGVAKGMAVLMGIGAGALLLLAGPVGWVMMGLMAAGAATILLITPTLVQFAAALLNLCKSAAGIYVDPGESEKVVAAMEGMGKASKAIAEMLNSTIKDIVPLTEGWFLGWFGDSPLDDLEEALPEIEHTIKIMAKFLAGLMRSLSVKFPDEGQLGGSIEIIKNLGVMSSSVAQSLNVASKELDPLTKGWFLGYFGDSPLDDLEEAIPDIEHAMDVLSQFLGRVMIQAIGNFPKDGSGQQY